jgi:RAWUL domain RING finger- and  WD40-associated ubiquitin-like
MESILGNIITLNNIPQKRYLQAPAAFKVAHLKKFLSSKYDLSNLKKSMNIDIIHEGDILLDDFSLMDIAYAYGWQRVSVIEVTFSITFSPPPLYLHLSHDHLGGTIEALLSNLQRQQAQ